MYLPRKALASLAPPVTTHKEDSIKREVPPIGKIFARLELKQNWAFFKGLT
jgi:hypothetical protein